MVFEIEVKSIAKPEPKVQAKKIFWALAILPVGICLVATVAAC
jgi:hypothetical protein